MVSTEDASAAVNAHDRANCFDLAPSSSPREVQGGGMLDGHSLD